MADTVYVATNRQTTGRPTDPGAYGTGMLPRGNLTVARAFVAAPDFAADTVGGITDLTLTDWTDPASPSFADLWQSPRPIVVFIHGFANSFADAIQRAAFNRAFLAVGGLDANIVAFAWPSEGRVLGFPLPVQPYLDDQGTAIASAGHLVMFLRLLAAHIPARQARGLRTHLLVHSMGNRALAGAVEALHAQAQLPAGMFDSAVLAAADEPSDTFSRPDKRLNRLSLLARRIGILHARTDAVLTVLSDPINNGFGAFFLTRLGVRGPDGMADPTRFDPAIYDFLDAAPFEDWQTGDPFADFQRSHQYYRLSAGVRARLLAFLKGGRLDGAPAA
ncbi:MAG: alpha/beta hydrolase [Thermohalobaculum sp.]